MYILRYEKGSVCDRGGGLYYGMESWLLEKRVLSY